MSPEPLIPEAYEKRCCGPSADFPSVEAGLPYGAYLRKRISALWEP